MIIWIASYPKSGNTYIRSFLSAYYYSKNGKFDFDLLRYIEQFPDKQFFDGFVDNKSDAAQKWLPMQRKLISSKKIKFLKTHSAYGSYDNCPFTTPEVTIGGVYIVRDPRNIFTSLMNHFSLNEARALEMLLDENRGIKSDDNDYSTYSFLSTWSNHVKSWTKINSFKTILIKYEDLEHDNEEILANLIKFINELLKENKGLDHEKLKRAIETTKFDNLRKKENEIGFSEAIYSKDQTKKVSFFNLGFQSNWRKNSNKKIIETIEMRFENEMKMMGYLEN